MRQAMQATRFCHGDIHHAIGKKKVHVEGAGGFAGSPLSHGRRRCADASGECRDRCVEDRRPDFEVSLRAVPGARWKHCQRERVGRDAGGPEVLQSGYLETARAARRSGPEASRPASPLGASWRRRSRDDGHEGPVHRRSHATDRARWRRGAWSPAKRSCGAQGEGVHGSHRAGRWPRRRGESDSGVGQRSK